MPVQSVTASGRSASAIRCNRDGSVACDRLVFVRVVPAVSSGPIGGCDASVRVARAGYVVSVVFAYAYSPVYYNLIGVPHPLVVASQDYAVEYLVKALSVAGAVKLPAAHYIVLLYSVSRGQAGVVAAHIPATVGRLQLRGLCKHNKQINNSFYQRAAKETRPAAESVNGCFLCCCRLAVVRLHPGSAAHLLGNNGTIKHGDPRALKLSIIRIKEAYGLEAVRLLKPEKHVTVVPCHILPLINLHKPGKGAAVIIGVCNVRSCPVLLFGVVVLPQPVVRRSVRVYHVGLICFKQREVRPTLKAKASAHRYADRLVVFVCSDILDPASGCQNGVVFNEAVYRFRGKHIINLVQGFLVCNINLLSCCHYSSTSCI